MTAMDSHEPAPAARHIADLVARNLLIGGEPGSGKSFPLNLAAAATAVTDGRDSGNAESAAGPEVD